MLILALDTSGETCSIALLDAGSVLAAYHFRHERRLSERLNGQIATVLKDCGRSLEQVEGIAVGLGPGSFTGVRVGVTLAKTFAMVRAIPVVGISSLTGLVEPFSACSTRPMVAVTPTRRTESVAAFYLPGSHEPIAPPEVYSNSEIVALARERCGMEDIVVIGEATEAILGATSGPLPLAHRAFPTADAVGRLATQRLLQGESDDRDLLVPLYVTPTPVG